MALFGFGKKKEEEKCAFCGSCTPEKMVKEDASAQRGGVKVLGGGCAKCHELEANSKAALAALGLSGAVQLITDFSVIAAYGVMSTPALVVDEKVVSSGRTLSPDEITSILKRERGL